MDTKTSKRPSKSTLPPKQYIDGKTFACVSCRKGHRVKTCNHGRQKPIGPTNAPGRPASGSKKVCDCGKDCGCKDDCKCSKDCLCTQKMYLIVHVTKPSSNSQDISRSQSPAPVWQNENGEAETLKSVWADADGKLLDDQEAERRQREKERRAQSQPASPPEQPDIPKPTPEGGCRHRDKIKQEPDTPAPSRCTCGVACQCTLCPEHANNAATRQYNASILNHVHLDGPVYTPAAPNSCMGGQPQFMLTSNKPTQQDFQNFFPGAANGDYVMSYPVDNFLWPSAPMDSMFHASEPQLLSQPSNDIPFDESLMDWTQPQDDIWETRLGDASVDQISHFPFDPSSSLQVPPVNNFHQLSHAAFQYNEFDTSFQQIPLPAVSSPGSTAYSIPISAITSPPSLSTYPAHFSPAPDHFSSTTPVATPMRPSGSCCGSSREYTPNDMDMHDITLPNMPLSPISSPRVGPI